MTVHARRGGQLSLGDTRPRGADPADIGDGLHKVDLGPDAPVDSVRCVPTATPRDDRAPDAVEDGRWRCDDPHRRPR